MLDRISRTKKDLFSNIAKSWAIEKIKPEGRKNSETQLRKFYEEVVNFKMQLLNKQEPIHYDLTNNAQTNKYYEASEDAYVAFRVYIAPTHTLSNEEMSILNTMFIKFGNVVDKEFSKLNKKIDEIDLKLGIENQKLSLDYTTLKNAMIGKTNFAIQTDTHISSFDAYNNSNNKASKSDLSLFKTVLNSIKELNCDLTLNLGDIVRGYQYDTDFETRKTMDDIINAYSSIVGNCLFVIGNHDDGNLFYYDTSYNDFSRREKVNLSSQS